MTEIKNKIWLDSSYKVLEKSREYKGITYAIRYDEKTCVRMLQIYADINNNEKFNIDKSKYMQYINCDNVYIKMEYHNINADKVSKLLPKDNIQNVITIIDEYYDNPDINLAYCTQSSNFPVNLKDTYRPYDSKHIATCEYYESLAIEFIDSYLADF